MPPPSSASTTCLSSRSWPSPTWLNWADGPSPSKLGVSFRFQSRLYGHDMYDLFVLVFDCIWDAAPYRSSLAQAQALCACKVLGGYLFECKTRLWLETFVDIIDLDRSGGLSRCGWMPCAHATYSNCCFSLPMAVSGSSFSRLWVYCHSVHAPEGLLIATGNALSASQAHACHYLPVNWLHQPRSSPC